LLRGLRLRARHIPDTPQGLDDIFSGERAWPIVITTGVVQRRSPPAAKSEMDLKYLKYLDTLTGSSFHKDRPVEPGGITKPACR
jgi:hypothetical protein